MENSLKFDFLSPKCENFLKKIGNSAKIRKCLNKEQKETERIEKCVEKKAGPIGYFIFFIKKICLSCTNDKNPKNITVPVMLIQKKTSKRSVSSQQTAPTKAAKVKFL